jgi:hypothetical protein
MRWKAGQQFLGKGHNRWVMFPGNAGWWQNVLLALNVCLYFTGKCLLAVLLSGYRVRVKRAASVLVKWGLGHTGNISGISRI